MVHFTRGSRDIRRECFTSYAQRRRKFSCVLRVNSRGMCMRFRNCSRQSSWVLRARGSRMRWRIRCSVTLARAEGRILAFLQAWRLRQRNARKRRRKSAKLRPGSVRTRINDRNNIHRRERRVASLPSSAYVYLAVAEEQIYRANSP